MRKILPALALILGLTGLNAQISLTTNYLFEVGDTLFVSFADSLATVDLLGTGGPQVWDFNDVSTLGSTERIVEELDLNTDDAQFANADFKIQINGGSTNYYTRTGNQINLIGNLGTSDIIPGTFLRTPFNPAFVDRRAPLSLLDQFMSTSDIVVPVAVADLPQVILDAGGPLLQSFDSIRLNTSVDRTDVVDAYGTLTVDDATYDVLREKRTELRDVRIEAKLGFLPWADVTAQVVGAIPFIAELIEEQDTIITYQFWNDDHIEPIATVQTTGDGTSVTDINFKTNPIPSSVNDGFISANQVKMYPNPARNLATFEATGLQRGTYTLQLNNVLGRRLITRTFETSGNIQESIDVSALPSGMYLYSLFNARGRILATKRLLVGGNR